MIIPLFFTFSLLLSITLASAASSNYLSSYDCVENPKDDLSLEECNIEIQSQLKQSYQTTSIFAVLLLVNGVLIIFGILAYTNNDNDEPKRGALPKGYE